MAPIDVITPSRASRFVGRIGTGVAAAPFWFCWITWSRPATPGIWRSDSPAKVEEQSPAGVVSAVGGAPSSGLGEENAVKAQAVESRDGKAASVARHVQAKSAWFAGWCSSALLGE